jgi:hypothetical protein
MRLHETAFMRIPLVTIVLLARTAEAAPERLDALDFSNGAWLVQDEGSYGSGTSHWSAWNLSDGSDETGWSSAQNHPVGAKFVWELDTTWRLDTLALSTRNMQENQYPGISVRVVELSIASEGGAWRSLGKFTIGKNARKEFALPKNTTASRVMLEIVANHGNAEYSELAEVDLFGQRTAKVATADIAGDYKLNSNAVKLAQDGDDVFGCYDDGGVVWGTVTGRVVQVVWIEPNDRGTATFQVHGHDRLDGVWFHDNGSLAGPWSGPRLEAAAAAKCTPRRHGQISDGLTHGGRVVLYGIRFASDSDVPLPESSRTLEQLAVPSRGVAERRDLRAHRCDGRRQAQQQPVDAPRQEDRRVARSRGHRRQASRPARLRAYQADRRQRDRAGSRAQPPRRGLRREVISSWSAARSRSLRSRCPGSSSGS